MKDFLNEVGIMEKLKNPYVRFFWFMILLTIFQIVNFIGACFVTGKLAIITEYISTLGSYC